MGGYRTVCDPRPSLQNLESNVHLKEAWHELWEELRHQGDVGEASYAAVPHLVRIHGERKLDDWNTYALVAVIELARGKGKNPEVLVAVFPSRLPHRRQEYVHLTANRVSRTCGGFAGAILANCVPTL
jgi:hypothetical protein